MITPAQEAAVRQALGSTPGQMFSPSTTTQYTQYSPEKLEALKNALSAKKSGFETFANGLANAPQAQAFTGGFGEQIIDPWSAGLSSFARGFGNTYSEKAADAREAELKAAQLEAEADKKTITDQVDLKKDPTAAKQEEEASKLQGSLNALRSLKERNRQNVAGFDNAYDVKNPDGTINIEATMQKYKGANPHGLFGRNWDSPNSFWGFGESKSEADVRQRFKNMKETQLRNIYDTLRGSGAITEQEMATMAQSVNNATNPYELDLALDEFITNIEAKNGLGGGMAF